VIQKSSNNLITKVAKMPPSLLGGGLLRSRCMYLSSFDVSLLYSVDLGLMLEPVSRNLLQLLRAKGELFSRLQQGIENASGVAGSFRIVGDEGVNVKEEVNRSIALGGKNIFSQQFFDQHAPRWFKDDRDEHLSSIIARASDQVLTADDLELSFPDQNAPMCVYRGAELRLFRGGTLSLRFSFSNPQTLGKSYFSVDDCILLTRSLATQSYIGFQKRIARISKEWSDVEHPVARSMGLRFRECDLTTSTARSSEVRPYRTVVIDTLHQRDPNGQKWTVLPVSGLDGKQLLGILNLAPWYKQYNSRYLDRMLGRNVSYKDNEIFLCDGSASLIVLPEYWTTPRRQNHVRHLLLLTELLNSQLSYLHSLADSLERDIIFQPPIRGSAAQGTIGEAVLIKGLILQMENSGDVDSLVSHGFSRKYLEQVRNELNFPDRTAALHRRMSIVDARLTLESEQQRASRELSLSTVGVRIALLALFITLLLQLSQLCVEVAQLAVNLLNP